MIITIKKGKHYSNGFIYKILNFFNFKNKLEYIVEFDDSALYKIEGIDKYDINKLFGFSSGLHHKNSARFGWVVVEKEIFIYSYCYIDKKRVSQFITKINYNGRYKFSILDVDSEYVFTVSNIDTKESRHLTQEKGSQKTFRFGYKLWQYFGGNLKSPENITISLTKAK